MFKVGLPGAQEDTCILLIQHSVKVVEAGQRSKGMVLETSPSLRTMPSLRESFWNPVIEIFWSNRHWDTEFYYFSTTAKCMLSFYYFDHINRGCTKLCACTIWMCICMPYALKPYFKCRHRYQYQKYDHHRLEFNRTLAWRKYDLVSR